MVTAAVLAGGSGTRMGAEIPKQFLEINGKSLLVRSIEAFVRNQNVDNIIVAVGEAFFEYTKQLIEEKVSAKKEIQVIVGGATRSDTLFNVLEFMKEKGTLEGSLVLTHDAVRPFITDRIIDDNIAAAEKYGACNTVVSATDTILVSEDGQFISAVPPRSTVYHAQTPQSFNAKKLYELCNSLSDEVFSLLTDGCSVFTQCDEKVYLVRGEEYNIKITYPEDIKRAENIAAQYFDNK